MTPVRVVLLECDHVPEPLLHLGGDYGRMFVERFRAHAPEIVFERVDVIGGQALPDVAVHDGLLITGSRYSANDDFPWLNRLKRHVVDAVAAGVPVVGICFGHQLLADALGGRVERAAAGWGVGIHTAEVLTQREWMHPSLESFSLVVSHQDQVTSLPADSQVLATSAHAPIAALQIGTAVGFQGHPEFDASYAAALMQTRRHRIPAEAIRAGESSLRQRPDDGTVTRWLGNFLASTKPTQPAADADAVDA